MFHLLRAAGLLVVTASALPVFAQPAAPAPAAEPVAQARPLPYRSAFEGYQPFDDQKVTPWKESNDTVGRIGGWRAYAKEAQGAPASEPPAGPEKQRAQP